MAPDPTTAAYKFGAGLARVMPAPIGAAMSRGLGAMASLSPGERRTMVERHLDRAHGGKLSGWRQRRAVSEVFENYARYYHDSFRLPSLAAAEVDRGFTYEGFGHIEASHARGSGTILALPHLGGWEWAAFWLALVPGFKVTAVVEEIEPPELFEWFVSFRRALGMDIVPVGPQAGAAVLRAVKRNDILCLMSDRHVGDGAAVEVEFFGERTLLPAGPATIAVRTGAALIPVAVYFDGDGNHAVCLPPIPAERRGKLRDDITRITQHLANDLESLIQREPEQWHLMSPNWPSDFALVGRPRP